jgi:hypothetical protein
MDCVSAIYAAQQESQNADNGQEIAMNILAGAGRFQIAIPVASKPLPTQPEVKFD